jgi:hypothetical protein
VGGDEGVLEGNEFEELLQQARASEHAQKEGLWVQSWLQSQ